MKEVCSTIKILRQRYPTKYHFLIKKLYQNLVANNITHNQDRDSSVSPSLVCSSNSNGEKSIQNNFQSIKNPKLKKTKLSLKSKTQNENVSLPQISSESDKSEPSIGIEKEAIQRFKPRPTRYQVQQQFQRMKEQKLLNISGEVYDRFGKFQDRYQLKKSAKKLQGQNEQNLKRVQQWQTDSIKQYRIYANKVAFRFHSKHEQSAFYQKRLMAKTFSERGFRLDRVKQIYSQKMSALNPQGRRRKTASLGLVTDTYRRFELFLKESMNKNVRALTSQEVRYLYPVILTAHEKFTPQQYDCFRKFVKVTFDLGSVSIYQQQAIRLFRAIQVGLKQKIQQNFNFEDQVFTPLPVKNIPLLDIYAPRQKGGYEQLIQIDTESISLDLQEQLIKEQQLQFIDELMQQEANNLMRVS